MFESAIGRRGEEVEVRRKVTEMDAPRLDIRKGQYYVTRSMWKPAPQLLHSGLLANRTIRNPYVLRLSWSQSLRVSMMSIVQASCLSAMAF